MVLFLEATLKTVGKSKRPLKKLIFDSNHMTSLVNNISHHLLYSAPRVSLCAQVNNLHGKDLFPLL